jgi:hypothetical protein
MHAILQCGELCDCNSDEYDKMKYLVVMYKPVLCEYKTKCSAVLASGLSCSQSLPQSCVAVSAALDVSRLICTEVLAAPKFDYPISQTSLHPECTSLTAGAFRITREYFCRVCEGIA